MHIITEYVSKQLNMHIYGNFLYLYIPTEVFRKYTYLPKYLYFYFLYIYTKVLG